MSAPSAFSWRYGLLLLALMACSRPSTPKGDAGSPRAAQDALPPIPSATADASTQAKPATSAAATKCLEDVTCPETEATRLFIAVDDAHDPESNCFRFLDGAAVPRDVVRGRACLDRAATRTCDGSSADLGTAELAMMRIDGVGGPVDLAGARALFATCFDDVTKQAVLEHATAKERDATERHTNFCKDEGKTTLVSNECQSRARENERTRALLIAKRVAASLDDEGKRLFVAANKAYANYVDARGTYVYEVFRKGSIRNAMAMEAEEAMENGRREDLAVFSSFKATDATEQDVSRAAKTAAAALAAVKPSTPGQKKALAKTEATWKTYRDAEVALYEHVFGPTRSRSSCASREARRTPCG